MEVLSPSRLHSSTTKLSNFVVLTLILKMFGFCFKVSGDEVGASLSEYVVHLNNDCREDLIRGIQKPERRRVEVITHETSSSYEIGIWILRRIDTLLLSA